MTQANNLLISFIALAICAGLAILGMRNNFAEKHDVRPHRPPWMIISLGSISVGFMVVVHIANLLGFETGNR